MQFACRKKKIHIIESKIRYVYEFGMCRPVSHIWSRTVFVKYFLTLILLFKKVI